MNSSLDFRRPTDYGEEKEQHAPRHPPSWADFVDPPAHGPHTHLPMNFSQLVFLLPCRSLEELSLDREPDEAEQILAAWCALNHPALVACTRSVPKWGSAHEPTPDPVGQLIVVPPCCTMLLPSDWTYQVANSSAVAIQGLRKREEITAAALGHLETPPAAIDPEIEADFYALGYCHFLIEMLTRQLRYMSNLDEASYKAAVLAAADAAMAGDPAITRERLTEAFRILHQAREYFYPVESHLLDMTLAASTTLGPSLRAELGRPQPGNLLISAETLEEMALRQPETLEMLRAAVAAEQTSVIGGERTEHLLPLLPLEAIRGELLRGRAVYERLLGRAPKVFARRRFGLTPMLPQVLRMLDFVGAIHSTLDDGRFPTVNQSRIEWVGLDGEGIEAVARVPLDVSRPDAFLRLPQKLGSSMDIDHVATSVFAHWPGQSSVWYDMLKRITSYISAAGKFETAEGYFQQTGTTGQRKQHQADDYRSPYLRQAVDEKQSDPLSRWARYYDRRGRLESAGNLDFLAIALCGAEDAELARRREAAAELFDRIDSLVLAKSDADDTLEQAIASLLTAAGKRFARAIGCREGASTGTLLANPLSFARHSAMDMPVLEKLPDLVDPILAAAQQEGRMHVAADVPAMGFAFLAAGSGAPPAPAKSGWLFGAKQKPLRPIVQQEEKCFLLENEHFQLEIDRHTGAIRALFTENMRGPRIAQQIALRQPAESGRAAGDASYSLMAADDVSATVNSEVLGEIVARGRLCDRHGRRLAGFSQLTRVARGSRVVELEIEIDPADLPGDDPWASYYAARFAWGDESSKLRRGVNQACVPTDLVQLESPTFIEIATGKRHTTILTGGLPFHRRDGSKKLDSLLMVRGETARQFRLGIGIDLPNPMAAAIAFAAPQVAFAAGTPSSSHAWLFHIEAGNVVATHWEPIFEEGRFVGMRVRLLETEGRPVRTGLRSFRSVRTADQKNLGYHAPTQLKTSGDRVTFDIRAYGWMELSVWFS